MKPKVPWTKSMLEKFIEEGLLTEDEERVLRTRIAGWSIIKQSMEFGMSTSSISRIIKGIRRKYLTLQPKFPDIFPPIKPTKYERALDNCNLSGESHCVHLLNDFETACGKDIRNMTVEEITHCQKNCPYNTFYVTK